MEDQFSAIFLSNFEKKIGKIINGGIGLKTENVGAHN